jgi:SAM-dependent methyltransferase
LQFLASFDEKPNIVDLGCGNFYVGSKIRHLCDNYIACDIVQSLINWNVQQYCDLKVDFQVLDITKDELPDGDIVFIRQVFQHLSNNQIIKVMPKIALKYKYLVLTEHLPNSDNFVHNLDIPTGPDTRHSLPDGGSGVVLTSSPFNLKPINAYCLCEVSESEGILRTILYQMY